MVITPLRKQTTPTTRIVPATTAGLITAAVGGRFDYG